MGPNSAPSVHAASWASSTLAKGNNDLPVQADSTRNLQISAAVEDEERALHAAADPYQGWQSQLVRLYQGDQNVQYKRRLTTIASN